MKKAIAVVVIITFVVGFYVVTQPVEETPENGYLLGYELGSKIPVKSKNELIFFPFFKEAHVEIIEPRFGNPFEYISLAVTPKTHELYRVTHFSWFPTHKEGREFFNQVGALYQATYNKPEHAAKCTSYLWQTCSFKLGDLKLEMTLFENMPGPDERLAKHLDPKIFARKEMTIQEIFEMPEELKGKAQFILSLEYDKKGTTHKQLLERNNKEYDELVVEELSSESNLAPLTKH
ncbi:hypothetical protein QKW35_05610 [Pontibacterium granulatum]|uniref:hypothetical protein n=1 Tax=Pontibacterium granulatum TaxID=2036029 RepID=UPI00249CDFA7|nr:hypothetical protein [Pontibacterium granulatum]MDI3323844.1 hypothetical protein [Pontibacterium granulatum]